MNDLQVLIKSVQNNLDVNSLESLHALLLLIETFLLSENKTEYIEDMITIIEKAYEQLDKQTQSIEKNPCDLLNFFFPPVIIEDMQDKNRRRNCC